MAQKITLQQAGDSVSATIPKDMADRLHVGPGDTLYAVEAEQGILLMRHEPSFEEAMQAFEKVRRQYRNTLKKLGE